MGKAGGDPRGVGAGARLSPPRWPPPRSPRRKPSQSSAPGNVSLPLGICRTGLHSAAKPPKRSHLRKLGSEVLQDLPALPTCSFYPLQMLESRANIYVVIRFFILHCLHLLKLSDPGSSLLCLCSLDSCLERPDHLPPPPVPGGMTSSRTCPRLASWTPY